MSIDPAFFKRHRVALSRARLRHPEGRPPRARHLVHQVRPRRGPDGRPDQPLQHDVQPVLHGRQPGRLRPRARVGRGQEAPRRRGLDQAAPPDVGPVLRRRADALAALPAAPSATRARSATSRSSARRTASASPRTRLRAARPREAGLRFAYLQFDGVGNEHNQHRKVGNLYDVKLRAIENLHKHGIDVTLVVDDRQRRSTTTRSATSSGSRSRTSTRSTRSSFQPVSFTGRDEDIDDETRTKQRYTLSHLAHDVKAQAGISEPMRDWYPLSASGPFSDLKDLLGGLEAEWGSLQVRLPPQLRHRHDAARRTRRRSRPCTVPSILDVDRLLADIRAITDSGRHEALDGAADGPVGAAQPAARGHSGGSVARGRSPRS